MLPPEGSPDRRHEERRHARNGGRRWQDDPYIRSAFEAAILPFGKAVYRLRDEHDWSIADVGRAAGIDAGTAADIEAGRGDPRLSSMVRLAAVYGRWLCISPIQPQGHNPANHRTP